MKKIIIKTANGCSVCAWLLTSGGAARRRPSAHTANATMYANLKRGERAFALIRLQSARFLSRFVQDFPFRFWRFAWTLM